ncbi:hypothetical protein J6590_003265 [Homalodisca vitripennis]|nr:hypothetical protein J6590_003265 [Homalodisca vitripennis]
MLSESQSKACVLGGIRQKAKSDLRGPVIKDLRKILCFQPIFNRFWVQSTNEAKVDNAIKSVLGDVIEIKNFVSKANSRGQKMAILTLGARNAAKLLAESHIRIGWVRRHVRKKLTASKCFQCLYFGRVANCFSDSDISSICYKSYVPVHAPPLSLESCVRKPA